MFINYSTVVHIVMSLFNVIRDRPRLYAGESLCSSLILNSNLFPAAACNFKKSVFFKRSS
jgi:hypothetical protein